MDSLTIDEILEKIGSFGRYQFRLIGIMGFMKIFGDAFQIMILFFLAPKLPWKCAANSISCNVTGAITKTHSQYKLRCSLSRDDWVFDTKEFTSLESEWDLVCERASLADVSKSVVFAGYMIGVLFGGILSEKFGRRQMVYFPSVLCNVLAFAASFVSTYWVFIFLRAVIGVCIGSSSLSMYVLLVEYVGVKHRASAGTSMWYFFTFSLMLLPLFGYLVRDWRHLSIAAAVPGLLQIFFWWYLPESPRWYMVNNKEQQARDALSGVARFNNKEMPPNPICVTIKKQRVGDLRDLFRSRKAIHITLGSWLVWCVNSVVYYGVSFSAGNFGANRYLEFFLQSIIEIPSHFIAVISMNRFGRKKTVLVGLIFSAIAITAAVLLQRNLSNTGFLVGNIILSMIAKFFINMSYDTVYVFSSELFPTVIRNVGMGTSSAAARIGSISAPFLAGLIRIHVLLPYSIFAVWAFIASLVCLTLPETLNTPTQEVFEEKPSKGPVSEQFEETRM